MCVESKPFSEMSEGVESVSSEQCEKVMRKSKFVALRLVLASVVSMAAWCSAQAADLDDYPGGYRGSYKDQPIVVPAGFSWTGFYIGGHLGYGAGNSSTYNVPGAGNGAGFDGVNDGFEMDPHSWMGGIHIGYNWQFDAFVFGLESDLGYLDAEERNEDLTGFADTEYGGYGTATARIGFAAERWMFYVKGGFAFADVQNLAGDIDAGVIDPSDFTKQHEIKTGWALGGGAEFAFQRDWSMKVEYLYMDFGDDRSSNIDGDIFQHENDIHTLKVGLSYFPQQILEPLK